MIEIIRDRERWNGLVARTDFLDFYFTFEYHEISRSEGEEPWLLVYRSGDSGILLPLLIREIEGTDYLDATSVYGYVGPLAFGHISRREIEDFQRGLKDFFL